MNEQMSLEEFKKQVEACLVKNCYLTETEAKNLMKECSEDIVWYFNKKLIPLGVANILTNPLY